MKKLLLFSLTLILSALTFGQTTYYVNSTSDDPSDNQSFRHQVNQANASGGHDTIIFNPGSGGDTIFFDSTVTITEGLTIIGISHDSTKLAGTDALVGSGIIKLYNAGQARFEFYDMELLSINIDSSSGIAQDQGTTGDTLYFENVNFHRFEYALFLDAVQNYAEVNKCNFYQNKFGVNLQVNNEDFVMYNCLFNSTRGAGAYIQSNNFHVYNNVFENQSSNPGFASVIFQDPVSPGTCKFINNTIINGNEIGLLVNCSNNNLGSVYAHNNIVWNNSPYDYKQSGTLDSLEISRNIIGTTDPASVFFPTFYDNNDPKLNGLELTDSSFAAIDSADMTYAPSMDYNGDPIDGSARDIGAIEYDNPCSGLGNSNTITNVQCHNSSNGEITANPTGGTAPYTYSWTGGTVETTQTISNLSANTYYLEITDNAGCNYYDTVVLANPGNLTFDLASMVITPASCGQSNGSVSGITATGGTGTLEFDWFLNGQFVTGTVDLTNAAAGTGYKLRVVDSLNCADFTNWISIPSNDSTISLNLNTTNAFCNGSFTGAAGVNPTGGAAPYTYSWSNGETIDSITNISAGTYWVYVTDASGCQSSTSTFTINEMPPLDITPTINPATCGSADGSIAIAVSGGAAPYAYSWSQPGISGTNATNLFAGNYQVSVTDANGCDGSANLTVPNTSFSINATPMDPTCNGLNDGEIDITVTPGGAYTYLWSNGSTNEDLVNVLGGFYTVTVSNGNCSQTDSFSIHAPAPVELNYSSNPASGCSTADGQIDLSAIGGNSGYIFDLYDDVSLIGSGTTHSGLEAGPYMALVVDANGCTDTATISLSGTSPGAPLIANINNITPSACLSSNPADPGNGAALATASGGTAPYSFFWRKYHNQSGNGLGSGTLISSMQNPTNLSSGNYVLEVEDSNGCEIFTPVTIPGANLAPQEICMVTVQQDQNNNQQNVVVWEKNAGLGIDYYEIWRLEANGQWQFRDTIEFASLSQYVDYGTDPNASYYSYQLRSVDECGNQSVYTANHATIQLALDTLNMTPASGPNNTDGSIDMQWNQYGGSLSLTEYGIRRIVVESGTTVSDAIIGTVPYNAATQLYTYTDNTMPGDNGQRSVFYQIEAVFPSSCLATKAQDYNGTRSNRSAGMFGGGFPASIDENEINFLTVYPNPSDGLFQVETGLAGGNLTVIDMFGKIVKEIKMNSSKAQIDLRNLNNGSYFLRFDNGSFIDTKKLMIINN